MDGFKKCFKCQQEKPRSEYYRHGMMADGYLGKCKECTKKDVSEHREKNIDRIRAYDNERGKLPHRKKQLRLMAKRFQQNFPARRAAHSVVNNAIRDGRLIKLHCFECGAEDTEAHHCDYGNPFAVTWLCRVHHTKLHAEHLKSIRDEHLKNE
jgi:hypothetical protein